MNILFVNYGDFTSNSLNHIGAFANRLTLLGHACVVAVPENPDTLSVIPSPLFSAVTFARALDAEPIFPNRGGADIIHAWTPRENVREFTLAYLARNPRATLFIHLEDNEVHLMESYAREPLSALRQLSDEDVATKLSPRLSHPVRYRNFLRLAHAVTFITDRLREFIPEGKPSRRLLPGIDAAFYQPLIADPAFRAELGIPPGEKLIVYTGSTTFANLADVRTLLLAVRLINERGTPCRLVRTGLNPPTLARELAAIGGPYVTDLGFVEKARLGPLLALADVLVQPGAPDAFNDYRLPSKVPEFFCMGRPIILPRANLAAEMQDGHHALLLATGSAEEIADKCLQVFGDDALAHRLSDGALEFARDHFDLRANTNALLAFYTEVRSAAHPLPFDPSTPVSEDVLLADGDAALRMRAKEATITKLHARGESLDREIATLTTKQGRLTAETGYMNAKLQEKRSELELLRHRLDDATAGMARLARELNTDELKLREAKIQRMTESFSWKITSPLRALRRAFIDQRKKPGRGPAMIAPKVEGGFAYTIDEPSDWLEVTPSIEMRGWVLATEGERIVGVRVQAAGKIFPATYGLARTDVAANHPNSTEAARSGFVAECALPPESTEVVSFESLGEDGKWHCFAAPTAKTTADLPPHLRRDYAAWVRRFDTPTLEEVIDLRAELESLPAEQRPLISIVMPVYNAPEQWLVKAIESVRAQIYPNWELCLADDASTEPHVRRVLQDFAHRDLRIKVVFREQNGHISASSNSALELASGEFVALLDHDDELAPRALAEIARVLATRPDLEFIYSDEDKIDELGRRFDPYFKPDWNPDLLLGQNYTCHLSVFRLSRVREVGGFRTGFEGSQDWDLTLRYVHGLQAAQIQHIPRVLYHWRAIPGSTALVIDQKSDYPFIAAKKALTEHIARLKLRAELVPVEGRHWRIRRELPSPPPKVSIVIPTRNSADLLKLCVGSILAKTTYPHFEIIVVNNRSDDAATLKYFEELRELKVAIVDFDAPFNFSALNNFAVGKAGGSLLAFLNNDLEVITPGWLDEMAAQALRPEIGAVGAMLYYPDDTVQHAGVVLGLTGPAGRDGVAGHAFKDAKRGAEGQRNRLRLAQNYSAVTAACLVIRRDTFEKVGGFNEADLSVAFNDIDFCLRVQQSGFRNLWTPFAEFYHHESATRGTEDTPEKIERFTREAAYMRRVWARQLDRDPAYNPNLTLAREDFSLAFPPR